MQLQGAGSYSATLMAWIPKRVKLVCRAELIRKLGCYGAEDCYNRVCGIEDRWYVATPVLLQCSRRAGTDFLREQGKLTLVSRKGRKMRWAVKKRFEISLYCRRLASRLLFLDCHISY